MGKRTTGSATLDFILTNKDEIIEGMESDHVMLGFTIMQARIPEQSQTHVLDFKRANFNKLGG